MHDRYNSPKWFVTETEKFEGNRAQIVKELSDIFGLYKVAGIMYKWTPSPKHIYLYEFWAFFLQKILRILIW